MRVFHKTTALLGENLYVAKVWEGVEGGGGE